MLPFRSLFSRTVLLFTIVMLISIFILMVVFWLLFIRPLADASSNHVSQHVFSIQQALDAMDETQQRRYIEGIQDQGVLVVTADDNPGTLASRPYQRMVMQGIREKLHNQALPVRFDFNYLANKKGNIIWVKINRGDYFYWVGYPLIASNEALRKMFYIQFAAILLLTIVSGFIIARSIKKPLFQLVYAANKLREGKIPRPIDESGPEELKLMAKTFNKMADDLQKSSEERKLMLAGISHDLRTPLARIRLAIEILDDQIENNLQEALIEDVETIDAILGQFLAFADNGDNEPAIAADLNALIQRVVDRYLQEGRAIELDLMSLPEIPLKKIAIQRLLMNLINNALEYGGKHIVIATREANQQIVLSISDNGGIISDADLANLKKPFHRKSVSRSNPQGAGLGLNIVEKIAQWHNASFELSANKGGGLTASILFPYR